MDLSKYHALPIWQRYLETEKKAYPLDELFSDAVALLDAEYTKAFPKYTLHNHEHVFNILKLSGDILNEKINELSGLECIIIILSAAYHDIGMVYSEKELTDLNAEPQFKRFIGDNYKAKLMYIESGETVNADLAEWYCRWNHAPRVWRFLDKIRGVTYGSVSLRDKLGHVCESHNLNASVLLDDKVFDPNFLDEADLKLCAVTLRLADIMDFDNSRSPRSVYEFLGLDSPGDSSEKVSKVEWQKHLCSDGFKFKKIRGVVELSFVAGPNHPQIEKNISVFLDMIEDELRMCSEVLSKSGDRWKAFRLPLNIDRKIEPQNYKTGDFSLSLDKKKVMTLLTGENLYESEFAFLRELMQNAIDTSRMREFHEHSIGNTGFRAQPIRVNTWVDAEGFRWLRVDDYGMGINEYVLTNHLLNKGNSFYKSDFFKIQKDQYIHKLHKEFTPISRFGIGLLSCFILGDCIEINTRAIAIGSTGNHEERLRLSIDDLESQYMLQVESERHVAAEMPGASGKETGFRTEYGTSLAVRINRSKDNIELIKYFEGHLKYYLSLSPIQVLFNGTKLGKDFDKILTTPIAKFCEYTLSKDEIKVLEDLFETEIDKPIIVKVLPLDISSNSVTENLFGQMVVMYLEHNDFFNGHNSGRNFSFRFTPGEQLIEFVYKKIEDGKTVTSERRSQIDLSVLVKNNFDADALTFYERKEHNFYLRKPILIHNGIRIPNDGDGIRSNVELAFEGNLFENNGFNNENGTSRYSTLGVIYLQDKLIPNLAVSRDEIKSLSFSIYSNIYYATRNLESHLDNRGRPYNYLTDRNPWFSMREVMEDNVVVDGLWDKEKILQASGGAISIEELYEQLKNGEVRINFFYGKFVSSVSTALVAANFQVCYCLDGSAFPYIIKSPLAHKPLVFPRHSPLLFLPFEPHSDLIAKDEHINSEHSLVKWFLKNQEMLQAKFENYFSALLNYIVRKDFDSVNKIVDYFISVLPAKLTDGLIKVSRNDFYIK